MHVSVTGYVANCDGLRPAGGTQVLDFSIADKVYAKGEGDKNQRTTWVRVAYFGKGAAKIAEYIKNGRYVTVHGEGSVREYEYSGTKRWAFEMRADRIELGPKAVSASASSGHAYAPEVSSASDAIPVFPGADEIPF